MPWGPAGLTASASPQLSRYATAEISDAGSPLVGGVAKDPREPRARDPLGTRDRQRLAHDREGLGLDHAIGAVIQHQRSDLRAVHTHSG